MTKIIEIESSDSKFLCDLIDFLNGYKVKKDSTMVRVRDGFVVIKDWKRIEYNDK